MVILVNNSSNMVKFLYGTMLGRFFLKIIMQLHLDRMIVRFLRSSFSKPLVKWYIRRYDISVAQKDVDSFDSFRDLFVRTRKQSALDITPEHLISPCDGWLSTFRIDAQSCFSIKNSFYRLCDILQDDALAKNYDNGICLIFRLCASDYHHYCYIDDGYQGKLHHIPGVLHSVQPIACEKFPVYILNKRCWCLLTTEHFGPVVQCEIGALIVGGIYNKKENTRFRKGTEKGHFEPMGSTIVLLFEPGQIELRPELLYKLSQNEEVRVTLGEWIGVSS